MEIDEKWGNGRKWRVGKTKGVKGFLPLGCLPLWGREGVTLIIFPPVNKRINSDRISPESKPREKNVE
jgi:hypothetical protein